MNELLGARWKRLRDGELGDSDDRDGCGAGDQLAPANQTIASGTTTTLNVAATGTLPLSYQRYQGISPNTATPVTGGTTSSFTTPTLTAPTAYWVRVANAFGMANSPTATIAIGAAPSGLIAAYGV